MYQKIFLLTLLIGTSFEALTPIYDIIGNISELFIKVDEENYYETVIDGVIEVMKNYAFLNIIKSPPKVNGTDYFPKVDVIQELENLKEEIKKETPTFYKFYQDILKIICKTKDYHIYFRYVGQNEPYSSISKFIISSPIEFDFQRNKSVLVRINKLISLLSGGTVQPENHEIIEEFYNNSIDVLEINGKNVYEFVRNYCPDYINFKSPTAKFIWNRENIKSLALWQCPLNPEEFKYFNITYSNRITISSNYIGFLSDKFIAIKSGKDNLVYNDFVFNQEYFQSINNENNVVNWDINIDNKIKCKVDNRNQVNVIYQNSFSPNNADPIGIINNISYCHGNFSNNDYPLIVIESLNGGGYAQLSKLMQQLVQDLMKPKNYFTVIHNENTREFLEANMAAFLFVDDKEKRNLTIYKFYEDKVVENIGGETIERSKQKLLIDLNFESLIKKDIFKRNKIKKPTDVIVFTDGLSFSSTSIFIKNLYYFGGAILVGYGGDPEVDIFDASQNPTFVLGNFLGVKGYINMARKGFIFGQLPIGPMYRTEYNKNNVELPEEFTINYIDERINLYNAYNDNLYEDFIFEAKKIFNKYKTKCNKNNKYMKLLSHDCTFDNPYTHGGYTCGEDGNWTTNCEPFYCDEDYYFDYNTNKCILWNTDIEEIPINSIKTISIDSKNKFKFKFISDDNKNNLLINMHSINCKLAININSSSNDTFINQNNNDTFSFRINNDQIKDTIIIVTPLIDESELNYQFKTCPLIITNFQDKNEAIPSLDIFDISTLYFDENFKEINFIYKINDKDSDSPIALSINFNQKTIFEVSVDLPGNEKINKKINSSTNILFNNEFNAGENIIINIKHIDNSKPIFINIKIIKKNSISILDKYKLNYGFITSNISYQYYYMEVFYKQEGEIMLHDKRGKGILFGKIVEKNCLNDPNDISIYPKIESVSSLKFNRHTLTLYFNNETTLICQKGCYLLISYFKEIDESEENNYLIGYEYNIFSRVWDYLDNSPQIVNIPFNEYIFGAFDEYSKIEHYYSIFIPNDTIEKIIIQLESNYIDGFIEEGIVKINETNKTKDIINLNIINNSNIFVLTKENITFRNNYMSLAFRPKNNSEDFFPFYFFRIFYLLKNESLYYPLDSNLENICLPEIENDKYYCNFILENKYNLIKSNFSLSWENQNKYSKIYYNIYDNNNTEIKHDNVEMKYIYINENNNININKFLFKFEFREGGIKSIISTFTDKSKYDFPQIYSTKMYYINQNNIHFNYSLKHNYSLTYKWIGGQTGLINISEFEHSFLTNKNFRGKSIVVKFSNQTKEMTIDSSKGYLIFSIMLNYIKNTQKMRAEEIKLGEVRSEIIKEGCFPLYYYLNLKNKKIVNVDINIRINSYNFLLVKNNYEIKGYILNEDSINKIIKGEDIQLKNEKSINGTYIEIYGLGFLQINKNDIKDNDYVLISINNKDQKYFNSTLLIEIVSKEYYEKLEEYFLPINKYLIESFNINDISKRTINKYFLDMNDQYNPNFNNNSNIIIEFSPNYKDLQLNFEPKDNFDFIEYEEAGFKKYKIINNTDKNIRFNVINPNNKEDANYLLKYYYTFWDKEFEYRLDNNFTYINESSNLENISVSLTFKNIYIIYNHIISNIHSYNNLDFYIYALLFPKDEKGEEIINSSAILYNTHFLYHNETKSIYHYDENIFLYFKDIFIMDYILQLRINCLLENDIFNEKILTFVFDLNLNETDETDETDKTNNQNDEEPKSEYIIWIIIGIVIFLIVVAIIVFIIYKKYKNKNKLEQKVLTTLYDEEILENEIEENAPIKKVEMGNKNIH